MISMTRTSSINESPRRLTGCFPTVEILPKTELARGYSQMIQCRLSNRINWCRQTWKWFGRDGRQPIKASSGSRRVMSLYQKDIAFAKKPNSNPSEVGYRTTYNFTELRNPVD